MNNIYVDELPKRCKECDFCEYFVEDAHGKGKHEVACYFNGFLTNALLGDIIEARHCTHLKLISDRLAEERKMVVQEIRNRLCKCDEYDCCCIDNMNIDEVHKFLDQIERNG